MSRLRILVAAWMVASSLPVVAQTEIAAVVNGENITTAQWNTRLRTLRLAHFTAARNPNVLAGQLALEILVTEKLLLQYAAKTDLLPSAADVEQDMNTLLRQPGIQQMLERKLLTEEDLKQEARVQRAMYNVATINTSISDAEVRAYFDANPEAFGQPEQWRLGVIRVGSREKAEKALEQVRSGTPFATAAAQHSEDERTRQRGGDSGFTTAHRLPAVIRQAAEPLKVGEVSGVVQATVEGTSQPVFFVLRKLAVREAAMPAFEEVKAAAERLACYAKVGGAAAVERKLAPMRQSAKISILLPGYEDLFRSEAGE
jgi:foldase protein PrsA